MDSISIVIPVYNSENSIKELTNEIEKELITLSTPFELIFIDDGSRDDSWSIIENLYQEKNWVRGIKLMRNFGQHNALLTGIKAAQKNYIVTMDDDLQHSPNQIKKLVKKLEEGYDVVYGISSFGKHNSWRNLSSKITKQILKRIMGIGNAQDLSPFRIFRADVREGFKNYSSPDVAIDVLLSWGTSNFAATEVVYKERKFGRSNYTFSKLVKHALNMIVGFSLFPLRIASWIGFVFTLFGFGVLIYVLVTFFILGGSISGFPFLASTIAIFSGAQLFALGIIGEYLARIYSQSLNRPYSVIQQTIGFNE